MIVSLTGFMGCGKSSVGKALAEMSGWDFVDLDTYIISRARRSISELFEEGEAVFRAFEAECLRQAIGESAANGRDTVLALGGGSLLDSDSRKLVLESTRCVYLKTSLEAIRSRLGDAVAERPLFCSENLDQLYRSRIPIYRQAHLTVGTDGLSVADVASVIVSKLSL